MSTIWSWLVLTLTGTITAIAHNLVFYLIAVPVVAAIAYGASRVMQRDVQDTDKADEADDTRHW